MVRKAIISDARDILSLVEKFAVKGEMLRRPISDIYENIRDFVVWQGDDGIVGVCALHVCWEGLGEIKSLAVSEDYAGKGIGRTLVRSCIDESKELSLKQLFALTYKRVFFERLGFRIIDKGILPHKIWGECVRCFKFPDCDEIAMMIDLD